VNAVIALEIMGFAILLAAWAFIFSAAARCRRAFVSFQRESVKLRRAQTTVCSAQIAEAGSGERNLAVSDRRLHNSQKLAGLWARGRRQSSMN